MYVISNRQFPQLFTENRVQTVTHVTWNGPRVQRDMCSDVIVGVADNAEHS